MPLLNLISIKTQNLFQWPERLLLRCTAQGLQLDFVIHDGFSSSTHATTLLLSHNINKYNDNEAVR